WVDVLDVRELYLQADVKPGRPIGFIEDLDDGRLGLPVLEDVEGDLAQPTRSLGCLEEVIPPTLIVDVPRAFSSAWILEAAGDRVMAVPKMTSSSFGQPGVPTREPVSQDLVGGSGQPERIDLRRQDGEVLHEPALFGDRLFEDYAHGRTAVRLGHSAHAR